MKTSVKLNLFFCILSTTLLFSSCGVKKASIRFNTAGAVALGATSGASESRSAVPLSRDVSGDDVSIIKLTESGNVELATEIEGSIRFSAIESIFKSPVTDDMFIWFQDESVNAEDHHDRVLSSLVCVHSDDSFSDLLNQDTQYQANDNLFLRTQNSVDFDEEGNAYILADEGGYKDVYVYKFNPKTKVRTTLMEYVVPRDEERKYNFDSLQISKEGEYLYIFGNYPAESRSFVRVIKVADTNDMKMIEAESLRAVYDRNTDKLYVSAYNTNFADDPNMATYKLSRNGTLETKIDDSEYRTLYPSDCGVFGYLGNKEYYYGPYNWKNLCTGDTFTIQTEKDYFMNDESHPYSQEGDYLYIAVYDWSRTNPAWNDDGDNELYDNMYSVWVKYNKIYELYRINLKTYEHEDLLVNCPYKDNLNIASWSLNDKVLYYSGTYKKENVNGKIDLTTFEHIKLTTSQRISSLAAM